MSIFVFVFNDRDLDFLNNIRRSSFVREIRDVPLYRFCSFFNIVERWGGQINVKKSTDFVMAF